MPSVTISVNFDGHEEVIESSSSQPKEWCKKAEQFFKSINAGLIPASVECFSDDTAQVAASGTITVASIQADDTITISGVTLTGKSSPSGESEFDSDGTDSVVAAAIVSKLNAHSSLTGIITASSSGAVVTVSAFQRGLMGNAITLASSNGTRLAVSAARLAGGTGVGESKVSFSLGK